MSQPSWPSWMLSCALLGGTWTRVHEHFRRLQHRRRYAWRRRALASKPLEILGRPRRPGSRSPSGVSSASSRPAANRSAARSRSSRPRASTAALPPDRSAAEHWVRAVARRDARCRAAADLGAPRRGPACRCATATTGSRWHRDLRAATIEAEVVDLRRRAWRTCRCVRGVATGPTGPLAPSESSRRTPPGADCAAIRLTARSTKPSPVRTGARAR